MTITYRTGNLLDAFVAGDVTAIGHCANCQGTMGSGIAADIAFCYPDVAVVDKHMSGVIKNTPHRDIIELPINISFVGYQLENIGTALTWGACTPNRVHKADKFIFNLYGQEYYGSFGRQKQQTGRNVSYPALSKALVEMRKTLISLSKENAVIGFPKHMASFRAGGNWEFVEELIRDVFFDFHVKIYTLPEPEKVYVYPEAGTNSKHEPLIHVPPPSYLM